MPNIGTGYEGLDYPIYDAITLAGTETAITFFQNPVGAGSTPKTLIQTNMRLAGQLQKPQEFNIMAICLGTHNAPSTDVIPTMKGWFDLIVGHKSYYQAPLHFVTLGGGFGVQQAAWGLDAAVVANWGTPDPRNMLTLRNPVAIKESEAFRVEVHWPSAPGVTPTLYCILQGMLKRAIQ